MSLPRLLAHLDQLPKEKASIGEREAEHGVTATLRFFSKAFPGRPLSMVVLIQALHLDCFVWMPPFYRGVSYLQLQNAIFFPAKFPILILSQKFLPRKVFTIQYFPLCITRRNHKGDDLSSIVQALRTKEAESSPAAQRQKVRIATLSCSYSLPSLRLTTLQ